MIEIDTSILNNIINNYREVLNQISENNTLIFENFVDLEKHWQDERFINLKADILTEKNRIINLQDDITKQISIYSYLENEYKKIGKKIKCNLNKKNFIETKISAIIDLLNTTINEYNNLGDISYYNRAYIINNQKEELMKIVEIVKSIKKEINQKFDNVKEIENVVEERLTTLSIETFILNHYEGVE